MVIPDILKNGQGPHTNLRPSLSDIGGPEFILQRCYSCRFSYSEKGACLFGESFFEGIQREFLRNPGFGMTLITDMNSRGFATFLHRHTMNLEGARHLQARPYLDDHDLAVRRQVTVVRFTWEYDVGPRYFERATGPSQRAGIKDRRNWDSGGYLWDCEISYIGIRARPASPNHLSWVASACWIPSGVRSASAGTAVQKSISC